MFSYDSDYECYIAEVFALPRCLSQAKTKIRDAIQGDLFVLQKHMALSLMLTRAMVDG